MRNLYKLDNINLNYYLNGNDIKVLKNINFQIKKIQKSAPKILLKARKKLIKKTKRSKIKLSQLLPNLVAQKTLKQKDQNIEKRKEVNTQRLLKKKK